MSKKTLALITLTVFLNFLFSCTTTSTLTRNEAVKTFPIYEIEAKKLQEVQLKTTSGEIHTGKLTRLGRGNLVLLPFPYWNVEAIKIDLDDIYSIKVMKKSSKAGKEAAGGFAWGFLITGTIAGLSSKYDEDFELALLGSAVIGAFVGLITFVVGGLREVATKSKYDLYKMSNSKKIRAIKKIMGL